MGMSVPDIIKIIACIIIIIIGIYWMVMTIKINRRKTSFLEKQMRLLARIAKKLGVDPEDVDNVVGGRRRKTSDN